MVLVTHKLHEVLRDNLDSRNWGSLKSQISFEGVRRRHCAAAFLSGGNILRLAGARVRRPCLACDWRLYLGLLVRFGHRRKVEGDRKLAPAVLRRYDIRRSEGEPRQPL